MPKPKPRPPTLTDQRGRPTKYLDKYCAEVVEHCKTGKSIKSFAVSIGVHIDTIHEWANKHKDFSEALSHARACAETYWENLGVENVTNRGPFNTELYKFMGKIRFRWTEPQEVKIGSTDDAKALDEIKEKYKKLLDAKHST